MADDSLLGGGSEVPVVPAEADAGNQLITDSNLTPSEGGFDWRSSLPTEYADNPALADIPDYGTMVKNYVNAQSRLGSSINLPGAEATPEEISAFHRKLGVPETAEGYKDAFTSAGMSLEGEGTLALVEAARAEGITPAAFVNLLSKYNEITGDMIAVDNAAREASTQDASKILRAEWGADYDKELGLAQQVVKTFGDDEFTSALAASGAGNSPAVIKAFAAIGAALANGGFIDGSTVGALSKQDATAQANALMATPAYLNSQDPGHKSAMEQVENLFKIAYPGTISSV